MTDNLGDYLKGIEARSERKLDTTKCIYARLDGRAFHALTNNLDISKPSETFTNMMMSLTEQLVIEFNPDLAYVQSDEISLGWYPLTGESQFIFGAKEAKLLSVIPSYCASAFSRDNYPFFQVRS